MQQKDLHPPPLQIFLLVFSLKEKSFPTPHLILIVLMTANHLGLFSNPAAVFSTRLGQLLAFQRKTTLLCRASLAVRASERTFLRNPSRIRFILVIRSCKAWKGGVGSSMWGNAVGGWQCLLMVNHVCWNHWNNFPECDFSFGLAAVFPSSRLF